MNASYAELSKDVYLLSDTSSDDPDIPSNIPVVTTSTTATPRKVDLQKEKVATLLVEKNTAAFSLIKLQKEHLTMEVSQMLDKHHEELEDKLFEMKEKLHELEVRLLCISNIQSQVLSFQQQQSHLMMKITRGNEKLNELEIKINNALDGNN